ncbi:MAG: DinB family protein [Thermomicrobiales bacterium]
MQRNGTTLTPFYNGWERYQTLLTEAISPLSAEQLAFQAAPALRPVWMLAAHIIGTRFGWFQTVMGEGDPALAVYDPWDQDDAAPRTAAELVEGLEATWQMVQDCLNRWTSTDLDATFTTSRGRTRTRQWVIWHVLEHDIHHGGELFLTLGMHGLPTPDL